MTSTPDTTRQPQRLEQPDRVGSEWLEDFRQRFSDEFPEDAQAQTAVEATGQRQAKDRRF